LRVYRVFERKHAAAAFSGEGARLYSGRWNSAGEAVVYTAASFSLALLEIMANTSRARIPAEMVYGPIDLPDEVRRDVLDVTTLPKNWFEYPAPPECQRAGDSWVRASRTVALIVPSAVARLEANVLLNPAHSDFARLIIGGVETMAIDRRLIRRI
jgi:RES domain-containing protein